MNKESKKAQRALNRMAKALIKSCGAVTPDGDVRQFRLAELSSSLVGELDRVDRTIDDLNNEIYILVVEKGYRG